MLAVVHCSRCLCLIVADVIFPATSQDSATSSKKAKSGAASIPRGFRIVALVAYMLTSALLFFVVLSVVTRSNSASNPDIHSTVLTRQQHTSPWRIIRKSLKAVRVVGDFVGRAIMPSDLRIHYQSPSVSDVMSSHLISFILFIWFRKASSSWKSSSRQRRISCQHSLSSIASSPRCSS